MLYSGCLNFEEVDEETQSSATTLLISVPIFFLKFHFHWRLLALGIQLVWDAYLLQHESPVILFNSANVKLLNKIIYYTKPS